MITTKISEIRESEWSLSQDVEMNDTESDLQMFAGIHRFKGDNYVTGHGTTIHYSSSCAMTIVQAKQYVRMVAKSIDIAEDLEKIIVANG